jgi:hypothetical protein
VRALSCTCVSIPITASNSVASVTSISGSPSSLGIFTADVVAAPAARRPASRRRLFSAAAAVTEDEDAPRGTSAVRWFSRRLDAARRANGGADARAHNDDVDDDMARS